MQCPCTDIWATPPRPLSPFFSLCMKIRFQCEYKNPLTEKLRSWLLAWLAFAETRLTTTRRRDDDGRVDAKSGSNKLLRLEKVSDNFVSSPQVTSSSLNFFSWWSFSFEIFIVHEGGSHIENFSTLFPSKELRSNRQHEFGPKRISVLFGTPEGLASLKVQVSNTLLIF